MVSVVIHCLDSRITLSKRSDEYVGDLNIIRVAHPLSSQVMRCRFEIQLALPRRVIGRTCFPGEHERLDLSLRSLGSARGECFQFSNSWKKLNGGLDVVYQRRDRCRTALYAQRLR
jgi:hypothetical protein